MGFAQRMCFTSTAAALSCEEIDAGKKIITPNDVQR
jgi:hypothetical protein